MHKWKRVVTGDGPRFRSALDENEAALLRSLAESVVGMLDERAAAVPVDELQQITGLRTGHSLPPEDAALRRLLPDFHRLGTDEPADLNAVLRTLHEPEIIDAKRAAAQTLRDSLPPGGGRIELTEAQAEAWVAAVNDIRLALGTILQIGPDGPDWLPDDHPMAARLGVYHWLTALQEFLVVALMGRRR